MVVNYIIFRIQKSFLLKFLTETEYLPRHKRFP